MKYDFGGWVTKYDLECGDGRTILKGAFDDCDGKTVPMVWHHMHDEPENVLGNVRLEARPEGVYGYGTFNDTETAANSKELVKHGDITSLSIHANRLKEKASKVASGIIREVSLVLAGSNPGAYIDSVAMAHSDDGDVITEAVIYHGEEGFEHDIEHADPEPPPAEPEGDPVPNEGKTVQEVFDTFTDEQKAVVYALVAASTPEEGGEVEHADTDDKSLEGDEMKVNAFAQNKEEVKKTITHEDVKGIIADAMKLGSLKEAVLSHAEDYGVDPIETLFPDAKALANGAPFIISRPMEWVSQVWNAVRKTPFSRIKMTTANITAPEARALGYIKGNRKKEEVITVLKRTISPQTIYKKQKLDRDDIIDITDFDIVSWLKAEMRVMLLEEAARAIMIGDGRDVDSDDKIKEEFIRPILTEDPLYAIQSLLDDTGVDKQSRALGFIEECVRSRKEYRGSGQPTLYVGTELLTDMRLLKDLAGRKLYSSDADLAAELRVSGIVEIGLFDEVEGLGGIIVNLSDYTVGADRGGELNFFDDFDIDFNQNKYLLETRMSACLHRPYSAIVIKFGAGGTAIDPMTRVLNVNDVTPVA
jgi:HK97 family phage prohead protease